MAVLLREALGDSLRRSRVDQGRTLREVSTSARVSLGYLSEVERGQKEASSELLAAICGALDVHVGEVLIEAGMRLQSTSVDADVHRRVSVSLDPGTRVVIPQPTTLAAA